MPEELEQERVAVLRSLDLLGQPEIPELRALARVAASICGAPAAAVNLLADDHQWQAATYGVEPVTVAHDDAMCVATVRDRVTTFVPDAASHPDYQTNPYVTGELGSIRSYVAVPLWVSQQVVGTLCAHSPSLFELTAEQISRLEDLAAVVASYVDLQRQATSLQNAAGRDALTGLYNRSVLVDEMNRLFARRDRHLTRPGIVFVDLNDFKAVNDLYGHAAGDEVLRETARRLETSVRETDLVVRLGGDEFVILTEESSTEASAADGLQALSKRVQSVLAKPFTLPDGNLAALGAAVGYALDSDNTAPDQLIRQADVAMYADKKDTKQDPRRSDQATEPGPSRSAVSRREPSGPHTAPEGPPPPLGMRWESEHKRLQLLSLTYVSSAVGILDRSALLGLLRVGHANNLRDGITGMLLHASGHFMQALEGPTEAVEDCFSRIEQDPRHCSVVVVRRANIDQRIFPRWTMGFHDAGDTTAIDGFDGFLSDVETAGHHQLSEPVYNLLNLFRRASG